jgi:copper ion binding protein
MLLKMKAMIYTLGIFFFLSCGQANKKASEKSETASSSELTEVTLHIGGMTCAMCVASIEKGVGEVKGVEYVKVVLNDSTAVVRYSDAKTGMDEIKKAVEKRGYTVKEY